MRRMESLHGMGCNLWSLSCETISAALFSFFSGFGQGVFPLLCSAFAFTSGDFFFFFMLFLFLAIFYVRPPIGIII